MSQTLFSLGGSRLIEAAERLAFSLFVETLHIFTLLYTATFRTIETLRNFGYYAIPTRNLYGLATLTITELYLTNNRNGRRARANHCALLHGIHLYLGVRHLLSITATFCFGLNELLRVFV
jgi:hypothetical protein